jgi:alpha-D-ribose 1-methylphosphonate 5-triphosphate synthase subunit PhnI
MAIKRRISATFKDLPGGQILGPTYDYTHRLLDFQLMVDQADCPDKGLAAEPTTNNQPLVDADTATEQKIPRVMDFLNQEGLIEKEQSNDDAPVEDITREAIKLPADRDLRLQNLARGDEGFLLALGYATQRGYGHTHPFAGEIRLGDVEVEITPPELGFSICIGTIEVTECEMVNQFKGSKDKPPQFTRGYGLTFGYSERKAMAMALVDRAMRAEELGEPVKSAAQDPEFVLMHSDNVEASGFVQHLKLPHYVDFQSELELIRKLRASDSANNKENTE